MRELEAKIISSALLVGQADRDRIFRSVRPEYFLEKESGEIFREFCKVYSETPKADSSAFLAAVEIEQQREIVMNMDSLISPTIASEQLPQTLRAFSKDYVDRTLKSRMAELTFGQPTLDDVEKLREEFRDIATSREIDSAAEYLRKYNDPVETLPTGFSKLDELLSGGLMRGTLGTIGARPSTGKTTFAINIATHDPNRSVLFVSIEMTAGMIYDRIVSDKADVKYSECVAHKVSFDTVKSVVEQYPKLSIADDVTDVEDIVSLIFELRPDMVVVDYMQIVTSKRRFTDNRQRIDYISRCLKSAAKQTGAQILSLSQITRGGKDKPTMSDLKESGALEQDSDYIILIYREYVNDKSNSAIKPEPTTVTLDKNKFGSTGELDMDFNGRRQRFTEATDVITRPVALEEENEDFDLPF